MEALIIEGPTTIRGTVKISGAKNAVLPIIAATLLTDEECIIKGVPNLRDVRTMVNLLEVLGAEIDWDKDILKIKAKKIKSPIAPYEIVKTMRASILVLGPLVAREKRARVSFPGGCAIGERPIDLHIKGLKSLGTEVEIDGGYVVARCERLKGTTFFFDKITVTGTENILMASVLAEGETILENTALEPEIDDLISVLIKMGAQIERHDRIIKIKGVERLNGFEHKVMPDRIETATFLIAGALCAEELVIENCIPDHILAVITKLKECNINIETEYNKITVKRSDKIISADVETAPYPGFPTDVQAQYMTLMSIADGTSVIKETIFEKRFTHAAELRRLGADITIDGNTAIVKGVNKLKGAPVMASDLRASASLVLAGLIAEGQTKVSRIYHLDRGYEKLDQKLNRLGARIRRIKE